MYLRTWYFDPYQLECVRPILYRVKVLPLHNDVLDLCHAKFLKKMMLHFAFFMFVFLHEVPVESVQKDV
jgi:hypothetical protein